MGSRRAKEMETELRMWWEVSKAVNRMRRRNTDSPILKEYRDEAEVIATMTSWPRLHNTVISVIKDCDASHPEWKEAACGS